MKLELYFTDEEVEKFLLSHGYRKFKKKEVVYSGPYDKVEDVVFLDYVRCLSGSEYPLKEKFDELIKKRLLSC